MRQVVVVTSYYEENCVFCRNTCKHLLADLQKENVSCLHFSLDASLTIQQLPNSANVCRSNATPDTIAERTVLCAPYITPSSSI